MDHQVQLRLRGTLLFFGAEYAFEQDDAIGHACRAQRQSLCEPCDAECICRRQGASRRSKAMAVGICFDDRKHLRIRRRPPHHTQVVAQCVAVDPRSREGH